MKLYPFQQEAVDKLWTIKSVLIGDEMGLGKTVESIALDMRRREHYDSGPDQKTLVVAPLSVLSVWEEHFREMCPDLKVKVIDPKSRGKFEYALKHSRATVFIVHWQALRLMPILETVEWFHIIGDEIHNIKNRHAQQTTHLKRLRTHYKTGASGTPADNRPDDLWSVLNWLYPKIFTGFNRFFDYHVLHRVEINHRTGKPYKVIIGAAHPEELHATLEPFFVRRLKQDVIKDLPDKYYTELEVDLYPKQRRAYNDMRDYMLSWVGEHEEEPVPAPVVIAQLVRLQQFACAYGQLVKVLRKGQYIDALKLTEPSTKIDAVVELVGSTDGPIVVFGQSKQVIHLLAERLKTKRITVCTLTGDTPQEDRRQLVEDFQSGKYQVFAGTITAGGIGITLTAASTVVFIDRAWNPSKNRQAEDRLHRIGQKNAVQVITLVATGTIDRRRNAGIEMKWEWIREVLGDTIREASGREALV